MKATRINDCVVTSFDLSDEQHDIAVSMVKDNVRKQGSYTLKAVSLAMTDVWMEDADKEYAGFLRNGIDNGDELLTLCDNLGNYTQELGEVIVSKC